MLERLGFTSAALDAKLLTAHALGLSALELATREHEPVEGEAAERVATLLQRRMTGLSVARIIGEREFYGLRFRLNAATLEPRPETELLVELALKALPTGGRLLDLGTGTGCIPIAVLANRPDATGVATDVSAEALAMARENAERHGVAGRLEFSQGSWFGALGSVAPAPLPNPPREGEGAASSSWQHPAAATERHLPPGGGGWEGGAGGHQPFDLIVSNPPYIASAIIPTLAPEVRDFDPMLALDGGPDGLAPYRIIAVEAATWLRPGGQVLVEIGYDQGEAVRALFTGAGFRDVTVHKDLGGLDRVVSAHHIGSSQAQGR